MTHYKFLFQNLSGDWTDSLIISSGTFNSAQEYLQYTLKTVELMGLSFVLKNQYRFLWFSKTNREWYSLKTGTFAEILQTYNIDFISNIVDIET